MKAQSCSAEVQLFGHGDEVAQVSQLDFLIHTSNILIETNKILDIWLSKR